MVVPPEILLPAVGIYAGWYRRPDGSVHPAAISLGRRPTFHPDDAPIVLEPYLLDFAGDLYGEAARVRFVARLRDEERYDSVDALKAQIAARRRGHQEGARHRLTRSTHVRDLRFSQSRFSTGTGSMASAGSKPRMRP